jgi:hypothetical protein
MSKLVSVISGDASKTIRQFCGSEGISRSKYYDMQKEGKGPDELRVDGIVRITPEAHAEWRRRHTVSAAQVKTPEEAA